MTKTEKQLHAAAKKNDTASLLALLQQGTNIHAADKDGQTALMLAADKNHLQAVQTLLAHGAQITAKGAAPCTMPSKTTTLPFSTT